MVAQHSSNGREMKSGETTGSPAAGLPRAHASLIGARVEALATHNALLTRWASYQVATAVLTHEVGPRVSPERSRGFERIAAGTLLLTGCDSTRAWANSMAR